MQYQYKLQKKWNMSQENRQSSLDYRLLLASVKQFYDNYSSNEKCPTLAQWPNWQEVMSVQRKTGQKRAEHRRIKRLTRALKCQNPCQLKLPMARSDERTKRLAVCMFVCVRERETDGDGWIDRQRERKLVYTGESMLVCLWRGEECVCVCVCIGHIVEVCSCKPAWLLRVD